MIKACLPFSPLGTCLLLVVLPVGAQPPTPSQDTAKPPESSHVVEMQARDSARATSTPDAPSSQPIQGVAQRVGSRQRTEGDQPARKAYVVVDASGSMGSHAGELSKLEMAARTVDQLLEEWGPEAQVGLVAFGHSTGKCDDIETLVPLGDESGTQVQAALHHLRPRGRTPLARSIRYAARALHRIDPTESRLVVISDWEETCGGNPCHQVKRLADKGVDLTAYVIGYRVAEHSEAETSLRCLAKRSGGTFAAAQNYAELQQAVRKALSLATGNPLQSSNSAEAEVEELQLDLQWQYITAEAFSMGSPESEPGRDNEDEKLREVELPGDFLITTTEISQHDWEAVMGTQPSYHQYCPDCPVERVSFFDAVAFANRLSTAFGLEPCYDLRNCQGYAGGGCPKESPECRGDYECQEVVPVGSACEGFRLPSDAEWEFAARGGTQTAFWHGTSLDTSDANCAVEDSNFNPMETRTGASYRANPFGLFDVHGNVWEWTWPEQDQAADEQLTRAQERANMRAIFRGERPRYGPSRKHGLRGGSFADPPQQCRSANRESQPKEQRSHTVGLRLVRSVH